MANIIASPSRYIQGKGELSNIRKHVETLGKKFFIIVSESGKKRVEAMITKSIENSDCSATYEIFAGECCQQEIDRISQAYTKTGCDIVIGIGGGKIQDTAKVVAFYVHAPVVIVPTIASTDAPCSALSVIYTYNGVFDKYVFLPSSPNIVLVDTDIVSAAPSRLLVAGMGDALATYFEARACKASNATNCVGGKPTLAAIQIAKLCYDTLLEDGVKAMLAVEKKVCTKAVENIIEANTYLSGIGFESGGLAGAHAIHNGFTLITETHDKFHGEKVAFGTLVQLVLENAAQDELEQVYGFCMSVGLPTTLADLGVVNVNTEKIKEVARLAAANSDTLHNMPFIVTPDTVFAAIMGADALGRYYKGLE